MGVATRCVHMAGEADAHHRVMPTCHAVGWVAYVALWYMLHTAMCLARTEVLQRLFTTTKAVFCYFVCICVLLCSINYTHTYRSVRNKL